MYNQLRDADSEGMHLTLSSDNHRLNLQRQLTQDIEAVQAKINTARVQGWVSVCSVRKCG